MKSSSMGRTFELAKLAAQVGLRELKSGDFSSRVEQAVLIAKSLSHLKGAAMKVGQLMSLDLDNYFPPEAIEILGQLQNTAIAHPFPEIERVLQSELSPEKRDLIESISPTPIAVASIGQVHRARYQGRDIVLKVQFAEVAGSVEADLKILKTLAKSFCQITGRDMNLTSLFQEFRSILEQELDYLAEAEFQREFRQKIGALKLNGPSTFRVPAVIKELSTKKVLAMDFEPGLTFRQWLNTKPSQEKREQLAVAILDLYFHEFFEWGLVQTDPNWGNFLIDDKGSHLSVCLLDFGATKKYSREFIQSYIRLLDFAANDQSPKLRALAVEMGLLDPRESEAAFNAFEQTLKTAIKPFFVNRPGLSYFDFSDRNHVLESQTSARALSRELVYSPPPHSIIFLHRKLAGVYSMLKSLNVQIDVSPYWQMMKDLSAGGQSNEDIQSV
jgi:aarF domain-containing kinase